MSGDETEKKPKGRRPRTRPNAGAGSNWLADPFADPVQETARRFVINLQSAIDARFEGESGRTIAGILEVDHNSLRKILAGVSYPDLVFIVRMETKFNKRLWPGRVR